MVAKRENRSNTKIGGRKRMHAGSNISLSSPHVLGSSNTGWAISSLYFTSQCSWTVDWTVVFSSRGRAQRGRWGCHRSRVACVVAGVQSAVPGLGCCRARGISGVRGLDVYLWCVCLLLAFLLPCWPRSCRTARMHLPVRQGAPSP